MHQGVPLIHWWCSASK